MIKKYYQYINENSSYNEIQEGNYIRLFRDNEFLGFFKINNKREENETAIKSYVLTVQKHEELTGEATDTIFMMNSLDISYSFDIVSETTSAGIMCVYNDNVLLVKPTDDNNIESYTYPKGKQNQGETTKQTAIREFVEEIGISIPEKLLDDKRYHVFQYFREEDGIYYLKTQHFWVLDLTKEQYKRYFNTKIIPRENLPLDEIEWAGFLDKEKASEVLRLEYKHILRFV